MRKYKVFISNQAERELNKIIDYVENELLEPVNSRKLFFQIKEKILELGTFPEKYPIIKNKYIVDENVRKSIINNYVIIYRVDKKLNRVDISHIFYSKSNWMKNI